MPGSHVTIDGRELRLPLRMTLVLLRHYRNKHIAIDDERLTIDDYLHRVAVWNRRIEQFIAWCLERSWTRFKSQEHNHE